jgi:hypothetical protein
MVRPTEEESARREPNRIAAQQASRFSVETSIGADHTHHRLREVG